jgi:acyl carrier protein
MPPLRGIIHAAMVLDDAEIRQLTAARFRAVMLPKMLGAWNLHTETLETPLDFFVMFSSAASLVGNPGQGSYAAANAFLDALAHHRRRDGLPALTINWGPLDVGYAADRAGMEEHLSRLGAKLLSAQQGLSILGQLLDAAAVQVAVMAGDWQRWKALHPAGRSPRFAGIMPAGMAGQGSGIHPDRRGESLRDAVAAAPPTHRQPLIEAYLRKRVASVMAISPSTLDVERPLTDLGLDSLMATELGVQLEHDLQVTVSAMKFLDGLSLTGLVTYALEQLSPASGSGSPANTPRRDDDVAAKVAEMSDEVIDRLLERLLPNSETRPGRDAHDPQDEDNARP